MVCLESVSNFCNAIHISGPNGKSLEKLTATRMNQVQPCSSNATATLASL